MISSLITHTNQPYHVKWHKQLATIMLNPEVKPKRSIFKRMWVFASTTLLHSKGKVAKEPRHLLPVSPTQQKVNKLQ